jgi:hypothetical protein
MVWEALQQLQQRLLAYQDQASVVCLQKGPNRLFC